MQIYITISWRKQIPLNQTFIFLLTTSAHEIRAIENSVLKDIVGFNLAINRPTRERNYHVVVASIIYLYTCPI